MSDSETGKNDEKKSEDESNNVDSEISPPPPKKKKEKLNIRTLYFRPAPGATVPERFKHLNKQSVENVPTTSRPPPATTANVQLDVPTTSTQVPPTSSIPLGVPTTSVQVGDTTIPVIYINREDLQPQPQPQLQPQPQPQPTTSVPSGGNPNCREMIFRAMTPRGPVNVRVQIDDINRSVLVTDSRIPSSRHGAANPGIPNQPARQSYPRFVTYRPRVPVRAQKQVRPPANTRNVNQRVQNPGPQGMVNPQSVPVRAHTSGKPSGNRGASNQPVRAANSQFVMRQQVHGQAQSSNRSLGPPRSMNQSIRYPNPQSMMCRAPVSGNNQTPNRPLTTPRSHQQPIPTGVPTTTMPPETTPTQNEALGQPYTMYLSQSSGQPSSNPILVYPSELPEGAKMIPTGFPNFYFMVNPRTRNEASGKSVTHPQASGNNATSNRQTRTPVPTSRYHARAPQSQYSERTQTPTRPPGRPNSRATYPQLVPSVTSTQVIPPGGSVLRCVVKPQPVSTITTTVPQNLITTLTPISNIPILISDNPTFVSDIESLTFDIPTTTSRIPTPTFDIPSTTPPLSPGHKQRYDDILQELEEIYKPRKPTVQKPTQKTVTAPRKPRAQKDTERLPTKKQFKITQQPGYRRPRGTSARTRVVPPEVRMVRRRSILLDTSLEEVVTIRSVEEKKPILQDNIPFENIVGEHLVTNFEEVTTTPETDQNIPLTTSPDVQPTQELSDDEEPNEINLDDHIAMLEAEMQDLVNEPQIDDSCGLGFDFADISTGIGDLLNPKNDTLDLISFILGEDDMPESQINNQEIENILDQDIIDITESTSADEINASLPDLVQENLTMSDSSFESLLNEWLNAPTSQILNELGYLQQDWEQTQFNLPTDTSCILNDEVPIQDSEISPNHDIPISSQDAEKTSGTSNVLSEASSREILIDDIVSNLLSISELPVLSISESGFDGANDETMIGGDSRSELDMELPEDICNLLLELEGAEHHNIGNNTNDIKSWLLEENTQDDTRKEIPINLCKDTSTKPGEIKTTLDEQGASEQIFIDLCEQDNEQVEKQDFECDLIEDTGLLKSPSTTEPFPVNLCKQDDEVYLTASYPEIDNTTPEPSNCDQKEECDENKVSLNTPEREMTSTTHPETKSPEKPQGDEHSLIDDEVVLPSSLEKGPIEDEECQSPSLSLTREEEDRLLESSSSDTETDINQQTKVTCVQEQEKEKEPCLESASYQDAIESERITEILDKMSPTLALVEEFLRLNSENSDVDENANKLKELAEIDDTKLPLYQSGLAPEEECLGSTPSESEANRDATIPEKEANIIDKKLPILALLEEFLRISTDSDKDVTGSKKNTQIVEPNLPVLQIGLAPEEDFMRSTLLESQSDADAAESEKVAEVVETSMPIFALAQEPEEEILRPAYAKSVLDVDSNGSENIAAIIETTRLSESELDEDDTEPEKVTTIVESNMPILSTIQEPEEGFLGLTLSESDPDDNDTEFKKVGEVDGTNLPIITHIQEAEETFVRPAHAKSVSDENVNEPENVDAIVKTTRLSESESDGDDAEQGNGTAIVAIKFPVVLSGLAPEDKFGGFQLSESESDEEDTEPEKVATIVATKWPIVLSGLAQEDEFLGSSPSESESDKDDEMTEPGIAEKKLHAVLGGQAHEEELLGSSLLESDEIALESEKVAVVADANLPILVPVQKPEEEFLKFSSAQSDTNVDAKEPEEIAALSEAKLTARPTGLASEEEYFRSSPMESKLEKNDNKSEKNAVFVDTNLPIVVPFQEQEEEFLRFFGAESVSDKDSTEAIKIHTQELVEKTLETSLAKSETDNTTDPEQIATIVATEWPVVSIDLTPEDDFLVSPLSESESDKDTAESKKVEVVVETNLPIVSIDQEQDEEFLKPDHAKSAPEDDGNVPDNVSEILKIQLPQVPIGLSPEEDFLDSSPSGSESNAKVLDKEVAIAETKFPTMAHVQEPENKCLKFFPLESNVDKDVNKSESVAAIDLASEDEFFGYSSLESDSEQDAQEPQKELLKVSSTESYANKPARSSVIVKTKLPDLLSGLDSEKKFWGSSVLESASAENAKELEIDAVIVASKLSTVAFIQKAGDEFLRSSRAVSVSDEDTNNPERIAANNEKKLPLVASGLAPVDDFLGLSLSESELDVDATEPENRPVAVLVQETQEKFQELSLTESDIDKDATKLEEISVIIDKNLPLVPSGPLAAEDFLGSSLSESELDEDTTEPDELPIVPLVRQPQEECQRLSHTESGIDKDPNEPENGLVPKEDFMGSSFSESEIDEDANELEKVAAIVDFVETSSSKSESNEHSQESEKNDTSLESLKISYELKAEDKCLESCTFESELDKNVNTPKIDDATKGSKLSMVPSVQEPVMEECLEFSSLDKHDVVPEQTPVSEETKSLLDQHTQDIEEVSMGLSSFDSVPDKQVQASENDTKTAKSKSSNIRKDEGGFLGFSSDSELETLDKKFEDWRSLNSSWLFDPIFDSITSANCTDGENIIPPQPELNEEVPLIASQPTENLPIQKATPAKTVRKNRKRHLINCEPRRSARLQEKKERLAATKPNDSDSELESYHVLSTSFKTRTKKRNVRTAYTSTPVRIESDDSDLEFSGISSITQSTQVRKGIDDEYLDSDDSDLDLSTISRISRLAHASRLSLQTLRSPTPALRVLDDTNDSEPRPTSRLSRAVSPGMRPTQRNYDDSEDLYSDDNAPASRENFNPKQSETDFNSSLMSKLTDEFSNDDTNDSEPRAISRLTRAVSPGMRPSHRNYNDSEDLYSDEDDGKLDVSTLSGTQSRENLTYKQSETEFDSSIMSKLTHGFSTDDLNVSESAPTPSIRVSPPRRLQQTIYSDSEDDEDATHRELPFTNTAKEPENKDHSDDNIEPTPRPVQRRVYVPKLKSAPELRVPEIAAQEPRLCVTLHENNNPPIRQSARIQARLHREISGATVRTNSRCVGCCCNAQVHAPAPRPRARTPKQRKKRKRKVQNEEDKRRTKRRRGELQVAERQERQRVTQEIERVRNERIRLEGEIQNQPVEEPANIGGLRRSLRVRYPSRKYPD